MRRQSAEFARFPLAGSRCLSQRSSAAARADGRPLRMIQTVPNTVAPPELTAPPGDDLGDCLVATKRLLRIRTSGGLWSERPARTSSGRTLGICGSRAS
jgi:hypothetical protein